MPASGSQPASHIIMHACTGSVLRVHTARTIAYNRAQNKGGAQVASYMAAVAAACSIMQQTGGSQPGSQPASQPDVHPASQRAAIFM